MNDEYIRNIIDNGTRTVVQDEPVPGMTRPLVVRYEYNGEVVIETIAYANSTDNDGWAQVSGIEYELQQMDGYQTIEL